ncbi:hypothetical protein [Novosphingobium lindaniclasticum]
MTDQVAWTELMRVRIDFYSGSHCYAAEEFALTIVDPDAAVSLALLRVEQSPYYDERVLSGADQILCARAIGDDL